jgi:hypothetical protein
VGPLACGVILQRPPARPTAIRVCDAQPTHAARRTEWAYATDDLPVNAELDVMGGMFWRGREAERPGHWALETEGYIYRFYDATGRLLYVGISSRPGTRLAGHRRTSAWFPQASYVVINKCENWHAADLAETKAIKEENPLYNVACQGPRRREARERRAALAED